jgi:uncharacterized protein
MKPKKKSAKKKVAVPRTKPTARAKAKILSQVPAALAKVVKIPAVRAATEKPKAKEGKTQAKPRAKKILREVTAKNISASDPIAPKMVAPEAAPNAESSETTSKASLARESVSVRRPLLRKKISKSATVKSRETPPPSPKPAAPVPKTIEIKQSPVPVPVRKVPANIPAILLEGDKPNAAGSGGPGQRYALGPTPSVEKLEAEGELPESYGTQQLLLAARDPHWLYAHWDLSSAQQRQYNSLSIDRHLVLRIHQNSISVQPVQEVHVHPESRHWFVHVARAGVRYLAELGYYRSQGAWVSIATSGATLTPPDTISQDTSAEFATIPFELPMAKLLSLVKEVVQENVPLAEALQEIIAEDHPELREVFTLPETGATSTTAAGAPKAEWTPAQESALAEVLSMDSVRRVWMGSLEITELIRRQVVQELASMAAAGLGGAPEFAPTSSAGAGGAIFSPPGGRKPSDKGFWFNINAELIIYGATEPNATVTIAGRSIRLRGDGSFSYRFALPDGKYELPVVAVSADQTDGRAAELVFSRSTEIRGDVGAHPQDPELKRPEAASL